jgi:putative membrane protein
MINRFSDHAANERTFLSWVRTAIAMMAFGFLVEKFDLFLAVMAPELAQQALVSHREGFGRWAGLALILLGVAIVAISAIRFVRAGRAIEQDSPHAAPGFGADLGLAVILVLVGLAMILYLSRLFG